MFVYSMTLDKNEWTILDTPHFEIEAYTWMDILYELWDALWTNPSTCSL